MDCLSVNRHDLRSVRVQSKHSLAPIAPPSGCAFNNYNLKTALPGLDVGACGFVPRDCICGLWNVDIPGSELRKKFYRVRVRRN